MKAKHLQLSNVSSSLPPPKAFWEPLFEDQAATLWSNIYLPDPGLLSSRKDSRLALSGITDGCDMSVLLMLSCTISLPSCGHFRCLRFNQKGQVTILNHLLGPWLIPESRGESFRTHHLNPMRARRTPAASWVLTYTAHSWESLSTCAGCVSWVLALLDALHHVHG